jgi:hypothetical protein
MRETRERAIEDMKAHGMGHLAALYEGLGNGTDVILVPRNKAPLIVALRPTRQGLIVAITDDTAEGPSGYDLPSLRTLAGQAGAWTVVAGAPVIAVYEAAAAAAATGEKVIIVETLPPGELPWTRFLKQHTRETAVWLRGSPSAGKPA